MTLLTKSACFNSAGKCSAVFLLNSLVVICLELSRTFSQLY